jgi:ribonuclease HII
VPHSQTAKKKKTVSKRGWRRSFEQPLWDRGFRRIAGVDEAGRGPLAGPVVAAACVIPPDVFVAGVDDSKRLAPEKRLAVFEELHNQSEILLSIGIVDAATIDELNIFHAAVKAMHLAIDALAPPPDYALVDGIAISHPWLPVEGIVDGDQLCYPIAAASIIAKVTRDRLMEAFHQQWPQYGFDQHKGYATPAHLQALEEHGLSPIHRRSFREKVETPSPTP